jgi:hypothetical protein
MTESGILISNGQSDIKIKGIRNNNAVIEVGSGQYHFIAAGSFN